MSETNQKMMITRLIIGILSLTTIVQSTYHVQREHSCDCVCGESFLDVPYAYKPLCDVISRFEKELLTVKQEIERRTVFYNDIRDLKEIMEEQDDLIKTLQEQVEKLSSTTIVNEALPTAAALIMREDFVQGDSDRELRMKEEKELVNNVSNLIAKVEEVENLTSKVQEELRSERRVRRHLEENLNETRFSIKMLDDKLLNVTLPMDSRVTQVEEIVLSSIENMNKTLFEDHLRKLYYRVDGVVYKNETKKLDERLDQVETGLLETNTINETLKITEELNSLVEILITMNQTITEKLVEDGNRLISLENKTMKLDELESLQNQMSDILNKTTKLDELEHFQVQMDILFNKTLKLDELEESQHQMANVLNKTTKLEEFENLQEQMAILLNTTEFMQTRAIDLWMDIQNVRNTTVQLEKELNDQSFQANKTVESVQQKISSKLQNLNDGLSSLKNEVLADRISLQNLEVDFGILSADFAVSESKIFNMTLESEKMKKEISTKIENLTGIWDNSLSVLAGKIEDWKNSKTIDDTSESSRYITQTKDTDELPEIDYNDDEVDVVRMRGIGPNDQKQCDLPSINDEHLLMSLENDSQGVQTLNFACRPIGQYVLEKGPVSLQCKGGSWDSDIPSCIRLKDEDEIIASNSAEELADLIPTILIEPNNVDKPFGLMGTNGSGYLIVYPNTNFKLHCLFPETQMGPATWEAEQFSLGFPYRMPSQLSKHRSTIEFDAISSRYSGIYTCKTPYNKKHSIKIAVEAVKCPAFQVESEREKAMTYNSHPDGGERVLSTTTQFFCEGGSSITAMCLTNGTWSRPEPTVSECPPRRAKIWGCDVFIKKSENDPDVRYDNAKRQIQFSCSGNKRLVGPSYATCINNSWTILEFPKCT